MEGLKFEEDGPNKLLMATVAGLQERPHEKQELAAAGQKQWFFFKKHALLSKASKKREITGTKQCDASMEEYNMAAAMIDAEPPVPGIHGVSVDGNQKAKRQRNLEQQAEKKEEAVKKEPEKLEAEHRTPGRSTRMRTAAFLAGRGGSSSRRPQCGW